MRTTIRPAGLDDLPAIFHLGEKAFTTDYPNLYRTWDEYEVIGIFQTSAEHCHVALTDDGTVIGFVLGSVINKRNTAWNYGHLLWLGVDPDYRRQGVAARLVQTFRDGMAQAGVRMLLMDTQESNERAVRFFESQGFGSPVRHVYMTRNISAETAEQRDAGDS